MVPGLKAAGAHRPAARVHLTLLHAPEDQSPPFVIGKHAEELVCASHDNEGTWDGGVGGGTEGRNTEDTNISIFYKHGTVGV